MNNQIKSLIFLLLLLISSCSKYSKSQDSNQKKGELMTYLDDNKNYPHLDENYQIDISSEKFDSLLVLYPVRNKDSIKYQDSLGIILAHKNGGFNKNFRMEYLRVTYTNERVGYSLLMTAEEVEKVKQALNLKMPYDVVAYLRDSTIVSEKKSYYLDKLKKECYIETKDSTVYTITDPELLDFAFMIGRDERLKEAQIKRNITPHSHD